MKPLCGVVLVGGEKLHHSTVPWRVARMDDGSLVGTGDTSRMKFHYVSRYFSMARGVKPRESLRVCCDMWMGVDSVDSVDQGTDHFLRERVRGSAGSSELAPKTWRQV